MTLLLDTHTLIWFAEDDPQLSKIAKQTIENQENEVFFSIASFWEMAIKISIGKLHLKTPLPELLPSFLQYDFKVQTIRFEHTVVISTLPLHHRDPFDRMLIAQAISENMVLVSNETVFNAYGIDRIW